MIEDMLEKKITDLVLVLNANTLEKRSKIRLFFEKNNFYSDQLYLIQNILLSFIVFVILELNRH